MTTSMHDAQAQVAEDRRIEERMTDAYDALFADVNLFADSIADWTVGQESQALRSLIAHLTHQYDGTTTVDQAVFRCYAARAALERLASEIVEAQRKRGYFAD